MKYKISLVIGFAAFGLLSGCSEESAQDDFSVAAAVPSAASAGGAPAAISGRMFDNEITKSPCNLLTLEAVAMVAGVAQDALQQQKIARMCLYTWDGGSAALVSLRTTNSVELARQGFESSYRSQTAEEVKKSIDALSAKVEKKAAAGEIDVEPEHVKTLSSAITANLSQGLQYENVAGLGDAASLEVTQSRTEVQGKTYITYPNLMAVLVGNLHYSVSFSRDGEPQIYRRETEALARAVFARLP